MKIPTWIILLVYSMALCICTVFPTVGTIVLTVIIVGTLTIMATISTINLVRQPEFDTYWDIRYKSGRLTITYVKEPKE